MSHLHRPRTSVRRGATALLTSFATVAALALVATPSPALAATDCSASPTPDGCLDSSFGTGGEVTTPFTAQFAGSADEVADVALDKSGKIIAVGKTDNTGTGNNYDFAAVRYDTDGSLDTSFGGDGRAQVDVIPAGTDGPGGTSSNSSDDSAYAVAVDAQNRVLIGGTANGVGATGTKTVFALVRLKSDGTPDTTFGGDGIVTTDVMGDPAVTDSNSSGSEIHDVAVQPDGKIVVGGYADSDIGKQFALARYNADGTLDDSFGTGGIVLSDSLPSLTSGAANDKLASINGLAIDPVSGAIYAVGTTDSTGDGTDDMAVARYSSTGVLDTTFGTSGAALAFSGNTAGGADGFAVAIAQDGSVYAVGSQPDPTSKIDNFAIAKINPTTGVVEATTTTNFGQNTDSTPAESQDEAHGIAIDSAGNLVVGGYSDAGSSSGDRNFALARYTPALALETSFGSAGTGTVVTDFNTARPTGIDVNPRATHAGITDVQGLVTIDANGNIVQAGTMNTSSTGGDNDFAVARFTGSNAPTLSVSDEQVIEGDSGTKDLKFTVNLNKQSANSVVTVHYHIGRIVSGGTATEGTSCTSGVDYLSGDGDLTFPVTGGPQSQTIPVTICGDTAFEDDETFCVTLSAPVNASLDPAHTMGTGTIEDNDNQLAITDPSLPENAGPAAFAVTLSRHHQNTKAVSVDYATSDGTATGGADYTDTSGSLDFGTAADGTVKNVSVPIVDDSAQEPNETFTVTLSGQTNATLQSGADSATGTIVDDDTPQLSIGDVSNAEGNTATTPFDFSITLDKQPSSDVTVGAATSPDATGTNPACSGTSCTAADYTDKTATYTFDSSGTDYPETKTFTVDVNGDTTVEPDETFLVSLSTTDTNVDIANDQAVGTIVDDDGANKLAVADDQATVDEGAGSATFTVTLTRADNDNETTVDYATADDSAKAGSDYTAKSGTLTFAPGETTKTVTVPITDDGTHESTDESFDLGISNATNATIATGIATQTIADDDDVPTVSIGDKSGPEGATLNLPVTLSNPTDQDVTVYYSTSDDPTTGTGHATGGGACTTPGTDYESVNGTPPSLGRSVAGLPSAESTDAPPANGGTITIKAGDTAGNAPVVICEDTEQEPAETFTVSLSSPTNASLGTSDATGTILASDQPAPPPPAESVPSAPRNVVATAGDGQASVTWNPPADQGSGPVTGYVVTTKPGGATKTVTGTSTTITGLTNGTTYTFSVAATNSAGTGPTADSNPVMPTAANESPVTRLFGKNRIGTAIAVSKAEFPHGDAGAVVLARSDEYPDALVGIPFAADKDAPMLLTPSCTLPTSVSTEIARVLGAPGRVYVLGGTEAICPVVVQTLKADGYQVTRIAGQTRIGTGLAVAKALGNPNTVLLASGLAFPDALTAGPAAAKLHGAVLLTDGGRLPGSVRTYLNKHPGRDYAIGGPAATADPDATAVMGKNRYGTAVAVAKKFFAKPPAAGLSTGERFPDALTGGARMAALGGPMLLSPTDTLRKAVGDYLAAHRASLTQVEVYGGPKAISQAVFDAVRAALAG